jgi:EAL domain-containing protein (putative c-di-GMP-specific phosphodiesterase class I)/GGDEF domain-containing protein
MSLLKQLWIVTALVMLLVFGATFIINSATSSQYLEEQLTLKNQDEATALALSLSQQTLDLVTLELQLATLVDLGAYEMLQFHDPMGTVLFARGTPNMTSTAPPWITGLFPINSEPASAQVTNGWNQLGTLTIKSADSFAYDELWMGAKRTLAALIVAIIAAGIIGSMLLRLVLSPLKQVVGQAQAIGQRRFATVAEPYTTEFAEVTRSMNELATRIKGMLNRESERLSKQRESAELDSTMGLIQREPFMARLAAKLEAEDAEASGAAALMRLGDLARLNQVFGRQPIDNALKAIGNMLRRLEKANSGWIIGRLNGSDICLIAPRVSNPRGPAQQLQQAASNVLIEHGIRDRCDLPTACVTYSSEDSIGSVMSALDNALLLSADQGAATITEASQTDNSPGSTREQAEQWLGDLRYALDNSELFIETFPVLASNRMLIHEEAMVRIQINGKVRYAGEFMPWVHRLDLSTEIDKAVVVLALDHIAATGKPTCANLTSEALANAAFFDWLESLVMERRADISGLSLELGEAAAFSQLESFRRLSDIANSHGFKVGVEHMGYRIGEIGKLSELGADYIKVDGLFSRDIATNAGNAALFRAYASIAQSLGLECIAEGVSEASQLRGVFELGATGACGRGVTYD